jgi:endonuclease/exonuclease/phosphatase family metal-dependent hydrolase
MKIVSWNCHDGFLKEKAKAIEVFGADVLVIQECKITDFDQEKTNWSSYDFYCDEIDSNLGIAIFSNKYVINRDEKRLNKENRYVIPYNITGTEKSFVLYSVWTKKPLDKNSIYLTPVYKVLRDLPSTELSVFIGDFNTGSIQGANNAHWYEDLDHEFATKGFMNCASGQEWIPTFYRGPKSWLDDHCFASTGFHVISFGIGNYDYWRKYSDHVPIIVDFDF